MHDIRRISQYFTPGVAVLPTNALVSSRLDFCKSLFRGLSCLNQHKLPSIKNTLACLVTHHRKYAHVTSIQRQLHWLPVKYRCMFKTATLFYRFYIEVPLPILNHSCLSAVIPIVPDIVTLIVNTLQLLHSTHPSLSQSNILAIVLPLVLLRSGMNSLIMCTVHHPLPPSGKSSKLTCLQRHSLPCHPCLSSV